MGNHTIDKQIKEQLDGRVIVPSSMAWDRLDAMLTVTEKPKRFSGFTIFTMVMCVSFFTLAFAISKSKHSAAIENKVLFAEEIKADAELPSNTQIATVKLPASNENIQLAEAHNTKLIKDSSTQNKKSNDTKNLITSSQEVNKGEAEKKAEVLVQNTVLNPSIYTENKTVVKVNSALEISASSLLASVERSLVNVSPKSTITKQTLKIDATSLLAEAEEKSEKSFITKFFKGVQETSSSLVATVNSRNDIKE